jgi:adenylate kinase family enzyme
VQRVAVLGCGGAGKTTFARRLGAITGLPVIHGDHHRAEWERRHPELIARERWIIDAMRFATVADRLARTDTVIFLDVSAWSCVRGVLARRARYGRRSGEDGVYGPITLGLVWWIAKFRFAQRKEILRLLESRAGEVDVHVLRSRAEAEAFLRTEARLAALRRRGDRPRARAA